MDRLPDSLLYYTQSISNYTTNTVKLNPLGADTIQSDGNTQLRVALPVNSVVNVASISLHCTVSTRGGQAESAAGAGDALYTIIPKGGISSLLNRVSVSCGGIALDNGFTPYYLVKANKDNLKRGQAKYTSDDAVLSQAFLEKATEWPNPDAAAYGMQKQLVQNNFLGLFECEPSLLDFSLLPETYITIFAASGNVLPIWQQGTALGGGARAYTGNAQFTMSNIYFTAEVCSIGSGLYDQLTQRILQSAGFIDVPYKNYNCFSTTVANGNLGITGSVSTMCLDRISTVARQPDPGAAANRRPVLCEGSTTFSHQQSAINFDMNSDKDLSFQYRINNAPNPLYTAPSIDAFNMVVVGDDRAHSNQRGGLVSSLKMWRNNCFSPTVRLCFDESVRRLSGLNVAAINCQIAYQPSGGTGAASSRELVMITEQTSILRISQGRAIAVVA